MKLTCCAILWAVEECEWVVGDIEGETDVLQFRGDARVALLADMRIFSGQVA